jgi:hypothetical protein
VTIIVPFKNFELEALQNYERDYNCHSKTSPIANDAATSSITHLCKIYDE